MSRFLYAVRSSLRRLSRNRAFTLSAIVITALGVGVTATVFTVVDAWFLRPLSFRAPDELVVLNNLDLPYDLGFDIKQRARAYLSDAARLQSFASVAAYAVGALNVDDVGSTSRVTVAFVTSDFFEALGRFPSIGQPFTRAETNAGGTRKVILSDGAWRRLYAGNPAILGAAVHMNGHSFVVAGVMPPDFRFPSGTDMWLPLPQPITPEVFEAFRLFIPLDFLARLRPGVSPMVAAQELAGLERQFPTWEYVGRSPIAALVQPLHHAMAASADVTPVIALASAALIVLLIGTANLAGLLVARSVSQRHEFALRRALGASRAHLFGLIILDNSIIVAASAIGAIAIAALCKNALNPLLPIRLLSIAPPQMDVRVASVALVAGALMAIAASAPVALGVTRQPLSAIISSGANQIVSERNGLRARRCLVVAEVALALVLLIGAGLMLESLRRLDRAESGMNLERVVTAKIALPSSMYSAAQTPPFFARVLEVLEHDPTVSRAAVVDALPLTTHRLLAEAVTADGGGPRDGRPIRPLRYLITPGYFATLGIPILEGRDFTASDDDDRSCAVVVNELLAIKLWQGVSPIGKRLAIGDESCTVIAVIGNVRTRSLGDTATTQVYLPLLATGATEAAFVVRMRRDGPNPIARLRQAVRAADKRQAVFDARSMEDVVANSLAPRRLNTILLSAFSTAAFVLAFAGIYSLQSYSVALRRREFAVRLALGSQARDLRTLVLLEGIRLAAIGIIIGAFTAVGLTRFLSSLLYEVDAANPSIVALAAAFLFCAMLVASLLPTRSATRVSPSDALRG